MIIIKKTTLSRNMQSIIFEDIKCSNSKYTFGRGKYGEFNVIIMKENGYINATKLCADGGKRFDHWLENKLTKELIEYIELPGISGGSIIKLNNVSNQLKGSYVHKLLIPHIASWVSCEFSVLVSKIVNEWIIKEHKESIREKDTKIDELQNMIIQMRKENKEGIDKVIKLNEEANFKLDESNYMLEETLDELVETKDEVIQVSETMDLVAKKLNVACIDRVDRQIKSDIEYLVFKKLDNEKQIKRRVVNGVELVYDYYVVRGRRAAINRSRFTGEVIAELVCTPNAITLYHNIKFLLSDKRDKIKHPAHNDIKHPKHFDYFVNHLCLHISEERFIKGINRVNEIKYKV